MLRPNLIRSVVVGTDLRAASDDTVRGAAELARDSGADLHIVHAYEEPPFGAEARDVVLLQRHHRAALLTQLQRVLPEGFVAASARVVVGSAAEVVLARADETAADLIVLGPHRTRGIADGLLGSTAERILKTARTPCLVLSNPLPRKLRRLLVPSDLSPAARGAVRVALAWCDAQSDESAPPADLVLAHVLSASGGGDAEGEERGVRRALQATVDGERERGDFGRVGASVEVLAGESAVDEILRFAAVNGVDLLVMGTQGDGLLLRALQGSVSSAVVRRATFPVLLVPPPVWMAGSPPREAREGVPLPATA